MTDHSRRHVLKYAGFTATAGGLFAATGPAMADEAGASEDGSVSESVTVPDGWSSLGGGPGNNGYVPETDGPNELTVDWEYDHGGSVAIVDDAVFVTSDGAVHGLAAADGSTEWETHDIGARETPAVTADGVYVGGQRLTKIDPRNGDVCCHLELDYDRSISAPVVANGLVFVVADGTLYAVDANEMEIDWEFELDGESLYEQPVAVADGAVFAVSESRVFALELADGTERWTRDDPPREEDSYFAEPTPRHVRYPVATDDVVAVGTVNPEGGSIWQNGQLVLFDTETGQERVRTETQPLKPGPITDDRIYGIDSHNARGYDRETGEQVWEMEVNTYLVSSMVTDGETVYAGLQINGETYGPDEAPEPEIGVYAIDTDSGETVWTLETATVPTVALVDGTLYACTEEELIAVRFESASTDEDTAGEDENETDGDESGPDADDDEGGDIDSDGNGSGTGSDGNESDVDGNESNTNGDPNGSSTGGNNESNSDGDGGSDEAPGFTAGTGLAGGAVTLEWLRRRVKTDENGAE